MIPFALERSNGMGSHHRSGLQGCLRRKCGLTLAAKDAMDARPRRPTAVFGEAGAAANEPRFATAVTADVGCPERPESASASSGASSRLCAMSCQDVMLLSVRFD